MSDRNKSTVSRQSTSLLTPTGMDVTYKVTKSRRGRTTVNILVLFFQNAEQKAAADAQAERPSHVADLIRENAPKLISIRHEIIKYDDRARTEQKIVIGWKAEKPDEVSVAERLETRSDAGQMTDLTTNEAASVQVSKSFDPDALRAIHTLGDDKATIEFLKAYLPEELGLTL